MQAEAEAQIMRYHEDVIREVEQLQINFDNLDPEPVQQEFSFRGLAKRIASKVTQPKVVTSPIMDSERLISAEWEGFIPNDQRNAIIDQLTVIDGVEVGDEQGLRFDSETHDQIEIRLSQMTLKEMQAKLRQVLDILNKNNARINETAGFHVHVDKTGMTAGEMANILFAWNKYEWAIVQQQGWQNDWSRRLTEDVPEEDVPAMEQRIQKDIQDALRQGHSAVKLMAW